MNIFPMLEDVGETVVEPEADRGSHCGRDGPYDDDMKMQFGEVLSRKLSEWKREERSSSKCR